MNIQNAEPEKAMALQVYFRMLLLTCCTVSLCACANFTPDQAMRQTAASQAKQAGAMEAKLEEGQSLSASRVAVTRDVLRQPSTNATTFLLDIHQPPGEWREPLTLEKAVTIALVRSKSLQESIAALGVPAEALQETRLRRRLATASAFQGPLYQEDVLTPSWPLALATELAEGLMAEVAPVQDEVQAKRLALAATAAALDVIQEVRESWYGLVAASQLHVATVDELLAAEAAWDIAQRLKTEGGIEGADFLTAQARYETARLEAERCTASLREARRQMQGAMGMPGAVVEWNTPVLLPMRPHTELALQDVEQHAVSASLELAMARQDALIAHGAPDRGGWALLRPKAEDKASDSFWNQESATQDSAKSSPDKESPNWAFPAPFFAPSFGGKSSIRTEMERDWRRYRAMTTVVQKAARQTHSNLLEARENLESVEATTLASLMKTQSAMAFDAKPLSDPRFLAGEHKALRQRRELIQSQLEYWVARSRMEHLLAGRMTKKPQVLTFRHVSIMQSPSDLDQ